MPEIKSRFFITPSFEHSATSVCTAGTPRSGGLQAYRSYAARTLVGHRPLDVADVQKTDLAEVNASEGMVDERVEPRLVDLDVEHAAAAGRDHRRLHIPLILGHVGVDPSPVQDGADDMAGRIEARPGVDDPEAHGVTGVCGQRMRHVLARIAVPTDPVRLLPLRLRHGQTRRLRESR